MPAHFAGHTSTFIPNFDASGRLVVEFSRNPKDFPINKWIAITPVKQIAGFYLRIVPENAARVISAKPEDSIWPDGMNAPSGEWNPALLDWKQFACFRYVSAYTVGQLAVANADFDILQLHQRQAAQARMTGRAILAFDKLANPLTAATVWGNHYSATASGVPGGPGGSVYAGTPTDPRLKKLLGAIALQINRDTLGVVSTKDLRVVINPVTAKKLAESQEVHTYLKESPFALAEIRGDVENQNGVWGLPTKMYGFDIVVDDTVRVKTPIQESGTPDIAYALGDDQLLVLARPGSLVTPLGPSFSTVTLFAYEEMVVEEKYDEDNRLYRGRVVDNIAIEVTAPVSGYFVNNIDA